MIGHLMAGLLRVGPFAREKAWWLNNLSLVRVFADLLMK